MGTQIRKVEILGGSAAIGKLGANSGVDIGDVTLTAGSSIVGKVGIDQTTPGTTNAVALTASEAHVGAVGGNTKTIPQTPTITAGAYSAKDAVGGLLTFANMARVSGGVITLTSLVLTDLGAQSANLVLVLFDRTFTATSDNAPFDPSDADMANYVGFVPIFSSDYQAFADNAGATVRNVGLQITLSGTSLFGQLMCLGTPTYASTADLTVKVSAIQD